MGRRFKKSVVDNGVTKRIAWIYSGYNAIAKYEADSNASLSLKKTFYWGVGLLAERDEVEDKSYFTVCDGNKNITEFLDSTGTIAAHFEYDSFGKVLVSSGTKKDEMDYGFSSEANERDTGLIYYNFRYYNTIDGRWLSRDPISENGGMNIYGYIGNDGVNGRDYLGLFSWTRTGNWTGGARGPYQGKVCSSSGVDTYRSLAIAITNNAADENLIKNKKPITKGTVVDVSALIEKLEKRVRSSVLNAREQSNFSFPTTDRFYDGFTNPFKPDEIDSFFGDQTRCVDCLGAVMVIHAKGLKNVMGSRYFSLGYKPEAYPSKTDRIATADARLGDWGYFENDARYKETDGAWHAENVLNLGKDAWWGHGGGTKKESEWIKKLEAKFKKKKGVKGTARGWGGEVNFPHISNIAMDMFDMYGYQKRGGGRMLPPKPAGYNRNINFGAGWRRMGPTTHPTAPW